MPREESQFGKDLTQILQKIWTREILAALGVYGAFVVVIFSISSDFGSKLLAGFIGSVFTIFVLGYLIEAEKTKKLSSLRQTLLLRIEIDLDYLGNEITVNSQRMEEIPREEATKLARDVEFYNGTELIMFAQEILGQATILLLVLTVATGISGFAFLVLSILLPKGRQERPAFTQELLGKERLQYGVYTDGNWISVLDDEKGVKKQRHKDEKKRSRLAPNQKCEPRLGSLP